MRPSGCQSQQKQEKHKMAKVCLLTSQPYREVYVNEKPVGTGCSNQRDDVQLVQLFLRIATEDAPNSPGFKPPGQPMIEPDGIFGPTTQKYISYFQEEVDRRRNAKLLSRDGIVDPVKSGSARGSLSNTMYTILALNAAMRSRRGDSYKIENEAKFPSELKKALFIDW
jgi:hypothetical protein